MRRILLLVLLVYYVLSALPFYTKITHRTDSEAKCLDGTPAFVYLHEGGDTKKILFYFLGGGSCADNDYNSTLQNCYQRSKGIFGTSKKWSVIIPSMNLGIMDSNKANSRFYNWTKIAIIYCDGAFHQGNRIQPIKYKDASLYFRGAVNTRSHFDWANKKFNFAQAEKIMLSGSSAGGIATFLWIDYVKTLVPNPNIVSGIVDSGIFYEPTVPVRQLIEPSIPPKAVEKANSHKMSLHFDAQSKQDSNQNLKESPQKLLITQFSNIDQIQLPNKECSSLLLPSESWKCLFIQYSYPTLKTPLLFIQSSYDANIIPIFLNVQCLSHGVSGWTLKNCTYRQTDVMNIYRNGYMEEIVPRLLKAGHSLWSSSCSWHAEMINKTIYDSDLQRVPAVTGLKMREAVENFVFNGSRINNVDYKPWPSNEPCAF